MPFHEGRPATTPDRLMRSRFSAYAIGLTEYVIRTTAPGSPAWSDDRAAWAASIDRFSTATRFAGLRVEPGPIDGHRAQVTFQATLSQHGHDASFAEQSTFVLRDGAWLYHGGTRLPSAQ
ncbi:MAG: SEC-C motif-containing protein [Myxococcota bacterium]|jgi:SEC-C motif-containing protein